MQVTTELVAKRLSAECGCPEEEWLVGGVTCTIHLEEDGSIHCFLDTGESETEMEFHHLASLDNGRELILGWGKEMLFAKTGWC